MWYYNFEPHKMIPEVEELIIKMPDSRHYSTVQRSESAKDFISK